jgi:type 1 fimbria pilin
MMRTTALACLAFAIVCTSPLAAQDKSQDKKTAPPKPKTISLSGCVVRNEKTPTQFTLEDNEDGGIYRLTGINMSDYVGKRVQIGGAIADSKKLVIKGGLTPSANVAAQAGNMDPARAAMAAAGGAAGPGIVDLPEFKVKSVRPVSGGCPN